MVWLPHIALEAHRRLQDSLRRRRIEDTPARRAASRRAIWDERWEAGGRKGPRIPSYSSLPTDSYDDRKT